MKISKLIFLILPLITLTGCPLMGDKKEEPKKETTAGNSTIPVPPPPPPPAGHGRVRALDRNTPLKLLIDFWEIRKNVGRNVNFYGMPAVPGGNPPWLEFSPEPFIRAMEVHYGYPAGAFWQYKQYLDRPINDEINSSTYEVSDTPAGRRFLDALRLCGLTTINVGTRIDGEAMRIENEVINPCVTTAYTNAYGEFIAEADLNEADQLDTDYGDDSPFILREVAHLILHPFAGKQMSPRTPQEVNDIRDLRVRITHRYETYMAANAIANPACAGRAEVGHAPHSTCWNGGTILSYQVDSHYLHSLNFEDTQFSAQYPYQGGLVDNVFNAIITSNEAGFIEAMAILAASHPTHIQRKAVLESLPDLFITKDFATYQVFTSYLHFLLNCTRFH